MLKKIKYITEFPFMVERDDGDFYYVKDVRTILQDLADEAKRNDNLDRLYIINEICEYFE